MHRDRSPSTERVIRETTYRLTQWRQARRGGKADRRYSKEWTPAQYKNRDATAHGRRWCKAWPLHFLPTAMLGASFQRRRRSCRASGPNVRPTTQTTWDAH